MKCRVKTEFFQMIHIQVAPHPVSGEHLCPILVDDLDDAGRLDPGLSVHLDRNSLFPQDGDLHLAALKGNRAENSSCQVGRFMFFFSPHFMHILHA